MSLIKGSEPIKYELKKWSHLKQSQSLICQSFTTGKKISMIRKKVLQSHYEESTNQPTFKVQII